MNNVFSGIMKKDNASSRSKKIDVHHEDIETTRATEFRKFQVIALLIFGACRDYK